jgi:crotonobetainyl-CoA:carnitine CoA-transferase CaiB-like acyl-CoA transferase
MGDVALRPPPALGQHSRVILEDAGFTAEEISRLIA